MINPSQPPLSMNDNGSESKTPADGQVAPNAALPEQELHNALLATLSTASGISQEEFTGLISGDHFNHQY